MAQCQELCEPLKTGGESYVAEISSEAYVKD